MTSVSTHVLDTASGEPVEGVTVTIERSLDGDWQHMSDGVTDVNGRIVMLAGAVFTGVYRLVFDTGGRRQRLLSPGPRRGVLGRRAGSLPHTAPPQPLRVHHLPG